ncbi:PRC-barrel domain-containing protein [Reyranella sp.]|uniref:PRC-barrel domain-containing protein n=1 Tax=Reyranella sp. TaxID=1929291 RepID=UPI003BA85898
MLKHIVLATFITCGAAGAYAQTAKNPQQAATPPAATAPAQATIPSAASADASKLIGRNIKNTKDETIGEIKSIYIGKDGKVDSVIASVGGFLGIGDREVRIAWSELKISDKGEHVMVNMTKDELKAQPAYKYTDESYRGQVFTDTGPYKRDEAMRKDRAADRMASNDKNVPARATTSTGDFNANGDMSADALIGTNVKNQNNETVGEIEDVYVGKDGAIKEIVVSVGGFLGMGTKNVAVKWNDVKFSRDDKDIVVMTNWTKDSLKAMPDYKYERREPVTKTGG